MTEHLKLRRTVEYAWSRLLQYPARELSDFCDENREILNIFGYAIS